MPIANPSPQSTVARPLRPDQAPKVAPAAPRPPRSRLVWAGAAAVVILVSAGIYLALDQLASRPESALATPARTTAAVRTGTLEQTLRLTGVTAAEQSAYLRAPYVRGRRSRGGASDFNLVLETLPASGSRVNPGDILASFDPVNMENRFDDFRAERAGQEATLETTKALLDLERTTHEQKIRAMKGTMDKAALDLKTAPVRSKLQTETFRLNLQQAQMEYDALRAETKYMDQSEQAQIRVAELDVRDAEIGLTRARANLDRMQIRSPFAGIVVVQDLIRGGERSRIRVGDQLRPGQPFLMVADPRSMIVTAYVNQVDAEKLRVGAHARVGFEAFPGLTLPARIYSVSPLARSVGRRGTYVAEVPVYLRLQRLDPRLIPSLTVHADVILDQAQNQTIIPRAAVLRDEQDGSPYALVKSGDNWQKRDIELGLSNNTEVAVTSGLSEGDVVSLAGQ
jgi:HlyD family secretion protein